jgi:hypothetical protein
VNLKHIKHNKKGLSQFWFPNFAGPIQIYWLVLAGPVPANKELWTGTSLRATNSTRYLTEILSKSATGVYPIWEEGYPCKILKTATNPTPKPKASCNKSYVGLAKICKRRFPKHKSTLANRNADGQTTLSKYVHRKRDEGLNPKVSWKYLETNVPDFNPVYETCKLCTREKFQILLNPAVATLNLKTEIFSSCRHRLPFIIGDPPD